MKFRITIGVLAVLQLLTTIGCNDKQPDNSAQQAAMMQQLASQQSSSNVKCSADANCVKQCQTYYQSNPSMLQICLNSTTPKQGKPTLDTTQDFVEICDANDVCALTPIDGIEQCWNTGTCATTPAPKEKE